VETQDVLYLRHALAQVVELHFDLFAVAVQGVASMVHGLKLQHV